MCHVHRVIPEDNSVLIVSYEPPKKADHRTTISTSALFALCNGQKPMESIPVRDSFGFVTKLPIRRSEPVWEADRRRERARFCGTMSLSGIADHCRSPQAGGALIPMTHDDGWDGSGPRKHSHYGWEHRKPNYKGSAKLSTVAHF